MMWKYILTITILVALLSLPVNAGYNNNTYSYDGAPMTVILINALNSLYSGDYKTVLELSDYALSANTPPGLIYIHEKSWTLLRDFSSLALQMNENNATKEDQVYQIYRLKIEISETLPSYSQKLLGYIHDPPTRYRLGKTLEVYLSKLDTTLDNLVQELVKPGITRSVKVFLEAPDQVYVGYNLSIDIIVKPEIFISKIRVILLTALPIYNKTYIINTTASKYTLACTIPGTEKRTYSGETTLAKLFVVVSGTYNNTPINAIISKQITLEALRPKLYFEMPHVIIPGQNLTMTIISQNDESIVMNASIKEAKNNTILSYKMFSIPPGKSVLTLKTGFLKPGFYTLILKVLPKDKYLPAQYSKAIAVQEPQMKAYAPNLILGPPFTTLIKLNMNKGNANGSLIVKQGGNIFVNKSISGGGVKVIQVPLGWTLIASNKHVVVNYVSPGNKTYASTDFNILTINVLSIIVLIIVFTSISTVSARGFAVNMDRLTRILSRASKFSGESVNTTFVILYRRFIGVISGYVTPPKSNETLREFYNRLSNKMKTRDQSNSLPLIWKFILCYEKYLYSLRKPKLSDFKKIYERITRVFR